MSESRTGRFLRFLSRIRSSQCLAEEDAESVSHLAFNNNDDRVEEVIHYANQKEELENFLKRGFSTFRSAELGLASVGWKELPVGGYREIREGGVASIRLAYKATDQGVPLESRHLLAMKVQTPGFQSTASRVYSRVWTEVEILKGLVHANIVGFYGMFAVDFELEKDRTDHSKVPSSDNRLFVILLEYANAGDLAGEVRRYMKLSIPEPGARFYMLQICAGVQYMHQKRIIHNDLHTRNILLKYKPNGTKVCMLCDFGLSIIVEPDVPIACRPDVSAVCRIAGSMMKNIPKSEEALQVISERRVGHPVPTTIAELLDFPWFNGPVHAPIPKEPTPLLQPEVVHQIGYLPPLDHAGTTSPPPVAHVVHTSPDAIEGVSRSDSRGGSFAQRMGERLRSIPHRVRARIRSLPYVGRRAARRQSDPDIEFEEQPSRRRQEH